MDVAVIGAGYVGVVTAAGLAEIGHDVICVDRDEDKVERLNEGQTHVFEPGLDDLLARHSSTRLRATSNLKQAITRTELSIICVDTPFDGEKIGLESIKAVSSEIGGALSEADSYHTVVVKSTVVPGTTDSVVLPLLEESSGRTAGQDFGVGVNPEFLREAQAVADFLQPDRLVLGAIDERAHAALAELYEPFQNAERVVTTPRTAELIKYAANSFFATLISFSNEIANLASAVDVDAMEVMHGVHLDRRLTPIDEVGTRSWPGVISYLKPGCGFGGSCFPKDVRSLAAFAQEHQVSSRILDAVLETNDNQPALMIDLLRRHVSDIGSARIAVLGLAFKPGTNDIRESPSLAVAAQLARHGASVNVFDPEATEEARIVLGNDVAYSESLESALEGADAVLLMTAWPEFGGLPEMLRGSSTVVVDGRRFFSEDDFEVYEAIGL